MINSISQKLQQINLNHPTKYKKAGVLIILMKNKTDKEYSILFTKRSANLSSHSGEVSFPGGKWEEGDENLFQTALRESNEEINLNVSNIKLLGHLNFLLSRHKIEVNPYVVFLEKFQEFEGNFEIDTIFTVPVNFLMNPQNIIYKQFKRKDLKVSIPSWVYNGNRIWGLTAMITADFLNISFDASIDTDLELIRNYDKY
ncbi:MAG: coenzyme A pyrophosphatase [Gammaproteobacteria bacterium]|nr:coenzyme A pyrophosphatase [Gammaproteobacteria bacterium]|tara:strand:+ start:1507 stop:2106 length:600 start_codon:yes stop_codon:yes gene_type:complete